MVSLWAQWIYTARVCRRSLLLMPSQIRHRYRLNSQTDPVPLFPDLLEFRAVPRERPIDWTAFFDAPGVRQMLREENGLQFLR